MLTKVCVLPYHEGQMIVYNAFGNHHTPDPISNVIELPSKLGEALSKTQARLRPKATDATAKAQCGKGAVI